MLDTERMKDCVKKMSISLLDGLFGNALSGTHLPSRGRDVTGSNSLPVTLSRVNSKDKQTDHELIHKSKRRKLIQTRVTIL